LDAPGESPAVAVVRLTGRIDRADSAALCERVRAIVVVGSTELVICEVSGLVAPDAAAVDALARMQLTARRLGCSLGVRHACPVLVELIVLSGLADVVRFVPG
jgi:anti-anti-sigma regulatory factor